MATVLLIGTLDTKGPETAYLRDRIRDLGCETLVLDSGILGEAVGIEADFSRSAVAQAAGSNIDALRNAGTRGKAVEEMLKGVRKIALDLFGAGKIHGAASLGGAEGAVLAAAAMKVLPVGFPKLIVSPLASGHRTFAPFVGTKDVLVMHSVVDILGLNPVSRAVFDNAAGAIAGMAQVYERRKPELQTRKAVAATMLGNTTRPLMHIRPEFEAQDLDLVIFHANGVGGAAMEELIAQGYFAAVLDYTLSEVAGTIAGGFHNGGATRLDAAAQAAIPQVVVPGCLDFMVFGAKGEVPEQFRDRPMYYHNPEFTLVRLTPDEQLRATLFVAEKLNEAKGAVTVLVPLGGGSVMDIEGGDFWLPETNRRCNDALRDALKPEIQYREVDAHINDAAFAEAAYQELMQIMGLNG
ncbi:MAG: Tm-1-like ATP-binding domain-containing protein [Chloroflexota bacterium]